MSTNFIATNAASSHVELDRKIVKSLSRRSDRPGLIYMTKWIITLIASGSLIYLAMGTGWVWPAMFLYGAILSIPAGLPK